MIFFYVDVVNDLIGRIYFRYFFCGLFWWMWLLVLEKFGIFLSNCKCWFGVESLFNVVSLWFWVDRNVFGLLGVWNGEGRNCRERCFFVGIVSFWIWIVIYDKCYENIFIV